MKNYAVLLLVLLSGCVTTLADVRERGTRHEFTMTKPPAAAAACVARNAENAGDMMWGHVMPTVREGSVPGTVELAAPVMFIADFVPSGSGSKATVYLAPQVLEFIRQRYLGAFHGC